MDAKTHILEVMSRHLSQRSTGEDGDVLNRLAHGGIDLRHMELLVRRNSSNEHNGVQLHFPVRRGKLHMRGIDEHRTHFRITENGNTPLDISIHHELVQIDSRNAQIEFTVGHGVDVGYSTGESITCTIILH